MSSLNQNGLKHKEKFTGYTDWSDLVVYTSYPTNTSLSAKNIQ